MTRLTYLQPWQLDQMRRAMRQDGCEELVRYCWKDAPEPIGAEMVRMASACEVSGNLDMAHVAKLLRMMAMGAQWGTIDLGLPGHPDVRVVLQ